MVILLLLCFCHPETVSEQDILWKFFRTTHRTASTAGIHVHFFPFEFPLQLQHQFTSSVPCKMLFLFYRYRLGRRRENSQIVICCRAPQVIRKWSVFMWMLPQLQPQISTGRVWLRMCGIRTQHIISSALASNYALRVYLCNCIAEQHFRYNRTVRLFYTVISSIVNDTTNCV